MAQTTAEYLKGVSNEAPSTNSRRPALRDWAGIEDHLMKYDEGRVTGYSEDIDTLLVFAGLFSAILSAFVVQTYPLLQPDSSDATNQLLAYGFSSQRRQSSIPSVINSTMNAFLEYSPFTPSTSARWINSLFFTSLVLSLAAALLGILAKQWIREYMQWNSPLAAPRENVLVRQMRFEAWEAWNVAATISAVPALLEVAMILFLTGMVILLWTLDDVVAICVTAVVSAFLLVVSAFTILPVLFRRCPYRSPTAWACVAGYNLACAQGPNFAKLCKLCFHALCLCIKQLCEMALDGYGGVGGRPRLYIRRPPSARSSSSWHSFLDSILHTFLLHLWNAVKDQAHPKTNSSFRMRTMVWPSVPTDWRYRDLESCKATKLQVGRWWTKWRDARPDAKRALATEWTELGENGQFLKQLEPEKVPETAVDALFVEISHTTLLLQALSWVQRSSQDALVSTFIEQCTELVHSAEPAGTKPYAIRMVADWCVLSSLQHNHLQQPQLALLPRSHHAASSLAGESPLTELRLSTGVHIRDLLSPSPRQRQRALSLDVSAPGSHIVPVLARMVAADLQHTLVTVSVSGSLLQERRTLELFNVLQALTEGITGLRNEPWFVHAVESLLLASTQGPGASKLAMSFPVACEQVKLSSRHEKDLAASKGRTSASDYESLILRYFERRLEGPSEHTLNMFVFACARWLSERRISDVPSPVVTAVLRRMTAAAEALSQLKTSRDVHGYEGADDGEWLKLLRRAYKDLSAEKAHTRVLRQLFHTFETAYRRGVLTGHQGLIRDMIHEGLRQTHEDLNRTCVDRKCPWISHRCIGEHALLPAFQNCPLLQKLPKDARIEPSASITPPIKPERRGLIKLFIPESARDSLVPGTVRFLPANDLRLPLLQRALASCRITFDRMDNQLVFSPGHTSIKSYETLLLEYFPSAADQYDEEHINMFILTVVRWLDTQLKVEYRSSAAVTGILERMAAVAEAILHGERRADSGCDEAEDHAWLNALLPYRERLARTHGPLFRRLLHVFERAFRQGVLVGPEAWITFYLHGCLRTAHENLSSCEDNACRWINHECTDDLWKRECALLFPQNEAQAQEHTLTKPNSLAAIADNSCPSVEPGNASGDSATNLVEDPVSSLPISAKGWSFWALYQAFTAGRVIVPVHSNRLVLSQGFTTSKGYESLLLHYFPSTFEDVNHIRLNIFVLTIVRWLESDALPGASPDTITAVLEKTVAFSKSTLSLGIHRKVVRSCSEVTDSRLIARLCARGEVLTNDHGRLWRQLLHAFEDLYRRQLLILGDQVDVQKCLHDSLERAHADLPSCENQGCPWVSHGDCSDLEHCVLLGQQFGTHDSNGHQADSEDTTDPPVHPPRDLPVRPAQERWDIPDIPPGANSWALLSPASLTADEPEEDDSGHRGQPADVPTSHPPIGHSRGFQSAPSSPASSAPPSPSGLFGPRSPRPSYENTPPHGAETGRPDDPIANHAESADLEPANVVSDESDAQVEDGWGTAGAWDWDTTGPDQHSWGTWSPSAPPSPSPPRTPRHSRNNIPAHNSDTEHPDDPIARHVESADLESTNVVSDESNPQAADTWGPRRTADAGIPAWRRVPRRIRHTSEAESGWGTADPDLNSWSPWSAPISFTPSTPPLSSSGLFGPRSPRHSHDNIPSQDSDPEHPDGRIAHHVESAESESTNVVSDESTAQAADSWSTADPDQHLDQREPSPSAADMTAPELVSATESGPGLPAVQDRHDALASEAALQGLSPKSSEHRTSDGNAGPGSGSDALDTTSPSLVRGEPLPEAQANFQIKAEDVSPSDQGAQFATALAAEPGLPNSSSQRVDIPESSSTSPDAQAGTQLPFEPSEVEPVSDAGQLHALKSLPIPSIDLAYLPTPPLSAYVDRPDPLAAPLASAAGPLLPPASDAGAGDRPCEEHRRE